MTAKLSDQLASADRTAGALPSQRTKDPILKRALESDNIDEVKGALMHVWLHYEALELLLSDQPTHTEMWAKLQKAIADGEVEDDVQDPFLIATKYMAGEAIEAAYDVSHTAGSFAFMFGIELPEALQSFGFNHLDYSDPERELSDEDLAKLSGQADDDAEDDK